MSIVSASCMIESGLAQICMFYRCICSKFVYLLCVTEAIAQRAHCVPVPVSSSLVMQADRTYLACHMLSMVAVLHVP